ncbi:MAG: dihydrolipoyl dehydrogenase [Gammaproteobacteria bacterium]|nr:dihydrolipoyl dehydrogenase [Gammaproteobacteria bacterium]MDE0249349.1 dihydrolipoyl dehydrogenase [Gammaproteobacteria bacterium]
MVGNGTREFDLVVIGSGPGGYVAAIRASQLGMKVACVEAEKLGGVCLNIGCIPTKSLLTSARMVTEVRDAGKHGIATGEVTVDLAPAQARSRQVSDQMNRGVTHLFRKNRVSHVTGRGRLAGSGRVEVERDGVTSALRAPHIIVATGSRPNSLPFLPIDGKDIWSSDEALYVTEAPGTLAIIGAGAIGMEFADIFEAYGTQVTILEALDRVLPVEDEDVSAHIAKSYRRRGMRIETGVRLTAAEATGKGMALSYRDAGGEAHSLVVDRVLSAVGRVPNTEDVGLGAAGVALSEGGYIEIDEWMRTNVGGVYAIGDCAGGPLLAHKATHEGIVCVEKIAGVAHRSVDYGNIPNCTYCHPEVASVGLTEAEAKARGYEVEAGSFPWIGNGRAVAYGDVDGFVKIVRDRAYSEILGAHIIGPHATELIAEFVLARHLESTVEEVETAMHPHPTLSEAIGEGALAALGRPIHI